MKIQSRGIQLALVMIVGIILAGCTGDGDVQPKGLDDQPAFDEQTGSVRGVVLDESELPLADASVGLFELDGTEALHEATTGVAGDFVLNFVEPGSYRLLATALGYGAADQRVEVKAGTMVDGVFLVLQKGKADVAYSYLDLQRRIVAQVMIKPTPECMFFEVPGVSPGLTKTCQGGVPGPGNPNGCGPGECCVGYEDLLNEDTNWKTQLGEVMWRPQTGFSGKGFIYEILGPNVTGSSRCGGINQNDPRDFMVLSDQPPIRNKVDDERMAEREISPDDRCCDWRWRIFSAWCDLGNCDRYGPDLSSGISEQPVDIYYTIFWKEPAPDDYTAVPVD